MEEKDKAVQNESVISQDSATPPVAEKETTQDQAEAQKDTGSVEDSSSQGKLSEEAVKSNEDEVTPSGKRSTRGERRIQDLLGKLKATQTQAQTVSPDIVNPDIQPLITDEEKATGAIDPEQLQTRFNAALKAERNNLKAEVMRDLEAKNHFESSINEGLSDLEATQKAMATEGNQDLEDMIAEQYRLANYSIDPYTGQEVFIPRVKMSQLYEKQKALLEKRTTARVAATNTKLADIVSESAGVVGSSTQSSEQDDLSESFDKARESGSDEDWASYLKKTGIAKV
jgi:hypothetical protein